MRIFALETNLEKAKRAFLSDDEHELFTIRYHPFLFLTRLCRQTLLTLLLIGVGVFANTLQAPLLWNIGACFIIWVIFLLPGAITSWIDWRYDAVVVTTDKVIILDQSSIFHLEARQMYWENFASVDAVTQFANIFPFGKICFDLKEGIGQRLCLSYVPHSEEVAVKLSQCVRDYQRRAGLREA